MGSLRVSTPPIVQSPSFHSRANGRRHGVTSCLAHEGRVYFTAKGDGVVASFAELGATP